MKLDIRFLATIFLTSIILFLLSGCSSPEEKISGFIKNGNELFDAGKYDKAQIEYKKALTIQNNNNDALWGMVNVYEKQGNFNKVYELCSQIVQQNPKYLKAQIKLGSIFIAIDKTDKLNEVIESLETLAPNNPDVLSLKAAAYFKLSDFKMAEIFANKSLTLDFGNKDAIMILAGIYMAEKSFTKALDFLDKGILKHPNDITFYLSKISIYGQMNDFDNVENVYKTILIRFPENNDYKKLFAQFYLQRNQLIKAEYLIKSVVQKDRADTKACVTLVALTNQIKGRDAAIKLFDDLVKQSPKSVDLKFAYYSFLKQFGLSSQAKNVLNDIVQNAEKIDDVNKARVAIASDLIAQGRNKDGELIINEILYKDPKNSEALLTKSKLLVNSKKFEDAIGNLRIVIDAQPQSIRAHLALAEVYELAGLKSLSNESYKQALTISKENPEVEIRYGLFLIRQNEIDKAEALFQSILNRVPNSESAFKSLLSIKIRKSDYEGAFNLAKYLEKNSKNIAAYHQVVGIIEMSRKKYPAAIEAFKLANENSPNNFEYVDYLVKAYKANNQLTEAKKLLENQVIENRNTYESKYLLASLLYTTNKSESEAIYTSLVRDYPNHKKGYIALYRHYIEEKKISNARLLLEGAVEHIPDDSDIIFFLANIYLNQNLIEKAIKVYEKQIKTNPDNLVILNNYLSLIVDHKSDKALIEEAYKLSQVLNESDVPTYRDTAGWVAFKAGRYQEAYKSLKFATDMLPGVGIFQFHLGQTYLALIDKKNAKVAFEAAIKNFSENQGYTIAEVKKVMADNNL